MVKPSSQPASSPARFPWVFFILVIVLAVPFWVYGAWAGSELLPGLPVAALMAVCPLLAALMLVWRHGGPAEAAALLRRSFDLARVQNPAWYGPAVLLMPLLAVLAFIVLRLSGAPVPDPQLSIGSVLLLCVFFFAGALGEELGWSGYAIEPMQARWGALPAGLALGAFWAAFHYIALAQAHRPVEWIAWWSLGTVALRVIMVWLYNRTGRSVFAVSLVHMTVNVAWQSFPVNGSFFDPRVSGILTSVAAAVIVLSWKPWVGVN